MRSRTCGLAADGGQPVNQGQIDADVAGLASLAEPTRRALYLYVTPRIAR